MFSRRKRKAIATYVQFMADGLTQANGLSFSSGGRRISQAANSALGDDELYDQRILGGGNFVEDVLTTAKVITEFKLPLHTIIKFVAQFYHIKIDQLHYPCKQPDIVRIKALISYIATRRHGIAGKDVAKALGYSPAAVSRAAQRGEGLYDDDKSFSCFAEKVNL